MDANTQQALIAALLQQGNGMSGGQPPMPGMGSGIAPSPPNATYPAGNAIPPIPGGFGGGASMMAAAPPGFYNGFNGPPSTFTGQ